MAFTVSDFQDLLDLLEQHPDWRAALRRHILPDDLLEVPALLRQTAESQRRTDEILTALALRQDRLAAQLEALTGRVDALTARVDALTARVDALTGQVEALTARVDALAGQVEALTARVDALTGQVEQLTAQMQLMNGRIGTMDGELMELRISRRLPALLGPQFRRARVLEMHEVVDLLDDALDAGLISPGDREIVLRADIVARARDRVAQADVLLVGEVSVGVGVGDVTRAIERAGILTRTGHAARAMVLGTWINEEARRYAEDASVPYVRVERLSVSTPAA